MPSVWDHLTLPLHRHQGKATGDDPALPTRHSHACTACTPPMHPTRAGSSPQAIRPEQGRCCACVRCRVSDRNPPSVPTPGPLDTGYHATAAPVGLPVAGRDALACVEHQACRPQCTLQRCGRAQPPVRAPPPHGPWASCGTASRRCGGLHPLLERFPRRKRRDRFGRNRDGLPGVGVPSGPRGAVAELKAPKTPQFHPFAGLEGVHNRLQKLREHRVRLGLRELHGGGHVSTSTALVLDISCAGGGVIVAGWAMVEPSHGESVPRPLLGVRAFARLWAV